MEKKYDIDRNLVSVKAYGKDDSKKTINQSFKYNEDGSLKSACAGNIKYDYNYNKEGMLQSKNARGKTLISYTYDGNNNIISIKDITGKSSIYSYDLANRVKKIQDDLENTLVTYDYYKNDNVKTINYGNTQSLVTVTNTGEVLLDYKYAYDLNGNRLQKVGSKQKNYYSYDSINRLTGAKYTTKTKSLQESFTYDKVGNRLSKTSDDVTEKYKYNVKNQLVELYKNNDKTLFNYDNQGNTIKEETKQGNNIFEYNPLNQQVKAITKEGNTLVNRYDAEGLRAEIEENEKLTKFIFHKDNVLVETDKDYNVVSRFTRGYEVVAADIGEDKNLKLSGNKDLNRYYYAQDEQGSTSLITDNNENVKNEYHLDAFGNTLESTEEVFNRITYTGQQFDGITKQYYLRARYYNPVIGRFTREDTYRSDGLNLYAYCRNNPVEYFDPSGYASENPWVIFEIQNGGKGYTKQELKDIYRQSTKGQIKTNKKSKRQEYLGNTPSKTSDVGKDVINHMDKYGLIQWSKEHREAVYFKSLTDKKWYDINEADMSHKNSTYEQQLKNYNGKIETDHMDAVEYWNTKGKYYGPRSEQVKKYMNNPDNYYLEHKSFNRSDGANLKNRNGTRMTYDDPITNKCLRKGSSFK